VLWLVSGLAEFGTAVYRFAKNTPGNMIFSSDIGLCGKKCSSAQNQSFWWPSIVLTAKQVCHSPVILVASDSWKHTAPMTGWPAWHTPYRDSNSILKLCRLDIVHQLATQVTGWQLTNPLDKSHTIQ